jgi:hypothetical protein
MALTENEKKVIEALRKIASRGNDVEVMRVVLFREERENY